MGSSVVQLPEVEWHSDGHGTVYYRGRRYELRQELPSCDWLVTIDGKTRRFTRGGFPAALQGIMTR